MKYTANFTFKNVLLVTALLITPTLWAQPWQVDYDASRIAFIATYDDIAFEASFRKFAVEVDFDPATIDQASIKASVDIASVDSRSRDRDEGMLEADWFDAEQHPRATFASTAFRKLDNGYMVAGDLVIKGVSRPVEFFLSWESAAESASLVGQTRVKRTDFAIGTGEWAEDDTIGFDVQITFDLDLTRP